MICDGVSHDCYLYVVLPPFIVCRASTGACDPEEVCDYVSPQCPPDIVFPPGTVCRASSGICDIAEVCDGGPECPADASVTACIDGDGCCPDGCSAGDDDDCLEVPALSLRGLALCLLILAAGGIVLLRQ